MKKRKGLLFVVLVSTMLLMNGCQKDGGNPEVSTNQKETSVSISEATKPAETTKESQTAQGETRVFTDSAGREITLPKKINKVAPSGSLAQIVLYTVCPDKLDGLASDFSDDAKKYIDKKYWGLPKFGQFYGKNANLNMEALIAESPDVIVDIGEAKKTVKEDMDALQNQLGIPVVFVEADLDTMSQAYDMLGELTGETQQAEKLAAYCDNVLQQSEGNEKNLPENEKKSVYFAIGNDGLHTNAQGSIHARVIEQIGAKNAAQVEKVSSGGGSEVSFEQLLLWQPDIIVADSDALYDTIKSDKVWGQLKAVKEGKVYRIPSAPYSFMSNPPSVNRMIGILWLGNLVYPSQYDLDMKDEVKKFYKLFYHIDVAETQVAEILK